MLPKIRFDIMLKSRSQLSTDYLFCFADQRVELLCCFKKDIHKLVG
jgi:hypothetical protein